VLGSLPAWFPSSYHDQHLSGDLLWFIAEIADLPVLIVLFMRWQRTDRAEAKKLDELSDEEMEALTQAHLRARGQ
jgi:cytochrome c oxidase assembly factor CtaG